MYFARKKTSLLLLVSVQQQSWKLLDWRCNYDLELLAEQSISSCCAW